MALPKRSLSGVKPGPTGKEWVDPVFKDEYPSLYSFLNDVRYEDGTVRTPGTISVFSKLGFLTLAINDNDRNVVAFINEATWAEALWIAEEGICSDSLDWKPRRTTPPGKTPPY